MTKEMGRLLKPRPDSLVSWWVELGEGAAQRGVLGLPYSVSKKGGECTGALLLLLFITELTLHKDSCVCVCVFSHSAV